MCDLAVAVTDDMRGTMLPLLLEEHAQIARLLSYPCRSGFAVMRVLLDLTTQSPHLRGKAVASRNGRHVPLDKFVPSVIAAFRSRFKSVFLEDPGDSGSPKSTDASARCCRSNAQPLAPGLTVSSSAFSSTTNSRCRCGPNLSEKRGRRAAVTGLLHVSQS